MDNPKTALAKSKSSNSTSGARKNTPKTDKTTRSSAEFELRATLCLGCQPLLFKKRGVYVAKKPTKISLSNTERSADGKIPLLSLPPILPAASLLRSIKRPSKKRFLTSVLNILSKTTAATQCPEETDDTRIKDKHRTRINKFKMRSDEQDTREEWSTSNVSKRKNKYKSRILNSQANRKSVTVLKSKKDIVQSSSNDSKCINVKYKSSFIDSETVKWAESLPPQENDSNGYVAIQNENESLVEKNSDPSTMVADTSEPKDKRSFYDFFVDMLKSTLNVYNVETELDSKHLPKSANSSKVTLLEVKESVACKLKKKQKVEEIKSQTIDLSRPSSQHDAYDIMPDEKLEWTKNQLMEQFHTQIVKQIPSSSKKKKRKLKSDSFESKKTRPLPKVTSQPMPNKHSTTKKDARKELLNLLKEELKMKPDTYEEPENFYDALKVIAKNKKRNREWNHDIPSEEEDDQICQFKPQRVLSRKSTTKQSSYNTEASRSSRATRKPATQTYKRRTVFKDQNVIDSDLSNHSLEVLGYEYERPIVKKRKKSTSSFLPNLHPENIIDDTSDEFWQDHSDYDTGPMREQRQYVLDKLGQLCINREGE